MEDKPYAIYFVYLAIPKPPCHLPPILNDCCSPTSSDNPISYKSMRRTSKASPDSPCQTPPIPLA